MKRSISAAFLLLAGLIVWADSALAQAAPTLTLSVTPNPIPLGGTITLTATLSPAEAGVSVDFDDEFSPGCLCGEYLGTAKTDASGIASVTVAATSLPLLPPAIRTHDFLAVTHDFLEFPVNGSLVVARNTAAVVCPAGQMPDATANACTATASYPLAVSGPQPASEAAQPARIAASHSSGLPLGTVAVVAGGVGLQAIGVVVLRRRRMA
jgi:hypothetical protein